MQPFKDLAIWQRSYRLGLSVYRLTESFPTAERYGMTSQIRRAAVSAPTNIAEGCRRRHAVDFARFLNMAEGSLSELESLLLMSADLGYASGEAVGRLVKESDEIAKMVFRFRQYVERRAEALKKRPDA
jgi:four helix bundle protein